MAQNGTKVILVVVFLLAGLLSLRRYRPRKQQPLRRIGDYRYQRLVP